MKLINWLVTPILNKLRKQYLVEIGMKSGNKFSMWFLSFTYSTEGYKWRSLLPTQLFRIDVDNIEYIIVKGSKGWITKPEPDK